MVQDVSVTVPALDGFVPNELALVQGILRIASRLEWKLCFATDDQLPLFSQSSRITTAAGVMSTTRRRTRLPAVATIANSIPNLKEHIMHLSRFPRVHFAHISTSVEPMKRLSEALGVDLWIKRDDCTGMLTGGYDFAFDNDNRWVNL